MAQYESVPGLVSVMMPAYNAESFIGQALDSVLSQTYENWELIVVNDGSTDGTAAVVARYADPRIRLVDQENGGESTARNTALSMMRGEFVAFLDADDQFLPQHLELTINYLNANPARDGVYTDGYHCDTDGRWQVVKTASGKEFRYAKALVTQPLCLTCHGESIPDGVKARLAVEYPGDKATGYSAGQVRGIISLKRPL